MPAVYTVTGNAPFAYDPGQGGLLIDETLVSFTSQNQQSYFESDDGTSVTDRNLSGAGANFGAALVTQFTYNQSTSVPEPASLLLLGSGILGAARAFRRRYRA